MLSGMIEKGRPILVLGVLAACAQDPGTVREVGTPVAHPVCGGHTAGSRWFSGRHRYREVAKYGAAGEEWLASIFGVVVRDDEVYVYDAAAARLIVLSEQLEYRRDIGGRGEGPGEFSPRPDPRGSGLRWTWIDERDGKLVVYDGRDVTLFSRDDRSVAQAARTGQPLSLTPATAFQIRLTDAGIVYASLRPAWMSGKAERQWRLETWRLSLGDGKVSLLSAIVLPEPPRDLRGVYYQGPTQARPRWDARDNCAVTSDGTSEWLVRVSLQDASIDSLRIALPDRVPKEADKRELALLLGPPDASDRSLPEPTAVVRIWDMALDPDGHLWLLPVQPEGLGGAVEVHVVNMSSGAARVDTVPAFPRAFGAPGVFYAEQRDSWDRIYLAKYELASRTPVVDSESVR